MTLFSMVVLILVHLPRITVASSTTLCNICGSDMLMYSRSLEREMFYVNGVAADKVSFCGALKSYNAIGGFSSFEKEKCEGFYTSICNLDASLDMHSNVPRIARRKILLESENIESKSGDINKHNPDSLVNPRTISMAIPAFFIFCSCLLCPCFRSRRKDASEAVLTKDSSSMDSIPSTEIHHASEFPGSPARMPGSPFRNPGSHLRVPPSPSRFSLSPQLSRAGSVHLNMSQVIKATQNFSPLLKIGEGGFGDVYRAQLQDGQIVAIKRAKKELINSLQSEFSSEVELLAKIEHRNLVRLLGYVDKGNERIIITEHVPNGTLREHLDGQHGKILDFNQRLEICIDVAHALTYLHLYAEKQIIHRDVKSSNILLTESFRAKVADFGFARLGTSEGDDQTHILTKVKGTVGYLDPEYMRTYQLTPKSDVFSFGILMTEILTGRRPVESRRDIQERITIKWAFNSYNDGNVVGLLDPSMNETVDVEILKKMFSLAFQCAAPTRGDRPNMKEVGEQLWLIRMDYLRSVRKG
ncbi:non-specific serine/threonine protein kinase [Ranunculus cassubicifolius]